MLLYNSYTYNYVTISLGSHHMFSLILMKAGGWLRSVTCLRVLDSVSIIVLYYISPKHFGYTLNQSRFWATTFPSLWSPTHNRYNFTCIIARLHWQRSQLHVGCIVSHQHTIGVKVKLLQPFSSTGLNDAKPSGSIGKCSLAAEIQD